MGINLVIIDYGAGNLKSAGKAFEHVLGATVTVSSTPGDLASATHIVLPGVGAFGDCAAGLRKIPDMVEALEKEVMVKKKPFLGICVGMQLLADTGYEYGTHRGLGWIKGEVKKISPIDKTLPIPHMGWNNLQITAKTPLLAGMGEEDVYFVHSYQFIPVEGDNLLATTEYGGKVTAAIARGNVMGVQFHPEKSQAAGLRLIKNFLEMK